MPEIALPRYIRFGFFNDFGVAVDQLDIKIRRHKLDSSGDLEYAAENTLQETVDIADGGWWDQGGESPASWDNDPASAKWVGLHGILICTFTAVAPSGKAILYVQSSPNNTDWPSDNHGHPVAVLALDEASFTGTRAVPFSF